MYMHVCTCMLPYPLDTFGAKFGWVGYLKADCQYLRSLQFRQFLSLKFITTKKD